MFDVSFSELMVIGVIALIVIGPERLPKVARTVGHLLGRAQRYVNDVKADIRREIELDDLRKFKSDMEEAAQSVQTSLRDAESSLREPAQAIRQELDDAAKAATGAVSLNSDTGGSATAETTPPPAPDALPAHPANTNAPAGDAAAAAPTATPTHPAPASPAPSGAQPSAAAAGDTAAKPAIPTGSTT
jgi:sec-independent protein translocase protein TatB